MTITTRPGPEHATEAALLALAVRLLKRQWPVLALGQEVRSHGRCRTDACALVRQDRSDQTLLIGVEAKLSDGARAVSQAAMNRYTVDASFVAMPASKISGTLLHEAQRHGVGVLAVSPQRLHVARPALVGAPDPVLRAKVSGQLIKARPRGSDSAALLVVGAGQTSLAHEGAA